MTRQRVNEELAPSIAFDYSIDDPNHEVNRYDLDQTIRNTLNCLEGVETLSEQECLTAWCVKNNWTLEIRSCLVIKVPDVWWVSPCTGSQIFECAAPAASCRAKGQEPTDQCPCSCRAAIQNDQVIITAPNLELLPWRLTELLTGCEQIQNVPRLAECGSPSLVANTLKVK
jgi:hypothetical protein